MAIVLKESERVSQSLEQFLDFALPSKQVFSPINLRDILDETIKILQGGRGAQREGRARRELPDVGRPLLRQRRPVQAGLLEPHQERDQGHARRRPAAARVPRAPEEGRPHRRRRHRAGDEGRGQEEPLRALLLRLRERAGPRPVDRPQDHRRLRRPDRRPLGAQQGDGDPDHTAPAQGRGGLRSERWKRS